MSKKKKLAGKAPPIKNYANGGASLTKRTLKAWTPQHYSSKSELDANLSLLRARAADLVKNSPIGAAAVNTLTTGVIGSGLKLFPRIRTDILNVTPEYARQWSRHVKSEFELWANSAQACDYLRRNNFYELQQIAFASHLTEGDCFCLFKRRLPTRDNPYSLRLQLVEAGRISNPLQGGTTISNVEMVYGNNRIVNGIEVDGDGAQVAIWVSNRLWNEPLTVQGELTWQRVRWYGTDHFPNVLHICRDTRPDMFRGAPLLASVIETLKQVSRYADAELSSAIVKSFFSVFFIQPLNGHNYNLNDILPEDKDKPCVDVSEYRLGSATIAGLPIGVDVKAINTGATQSTFEQFTTSFIKQISAAINLPAEVLLKTFNSSYSASRAALLQANDEFRQRKAWFAHDFLRPIYESWLTEAVATNRIDAPGFFDDPRRRAAWLAADWFSETQRFIDPVKEANAMKIRLDNGLSTYHKELAESGLDFDDVVETLKQERQILGALT